MSILPIHSWTDGYRALRKVAQIHRGSITVNPGTADAVSWPRTTGFDALAIASLFDDPIHARAPRSVILAWSAEMSLLASEPEEALAETYASNRSLWGLLSSVATQLELVGAPLPALAAWDAATAEITTGRPFVRNLGPTNLGTVAQFPTAATSDEMCEAQLRYFRALRGEDVVEGMLVRRVPRTTNGDVVQLATYWTEQLGRADHNVADVSLRYVYERWASALADVAQLSVGAPLQVVYAYNGEFWSALVSLATQIAATAEMPEPFTLYLDGISRPVAAQSRNAAPIDRGETIDFPAAATWDDAAQMQRGYFSKLRGEDVVPGGLIVHIPRTTNADVLQLAAYWSVQLTRLGVHNVADISYRHVIDRWIAATADVARVARGGDPKAVYSHNVEFWTALMTVAIQVAVTDEAPSRWTMVKESIDHSVSQLPTTLADALSQVADGIRNTLTSALAKPLLLVGGGLLGLTLLLHSLRKDAERP